ncbi:(2Fe-2S)-binding protein [Hahella ganghwensis]|uniref:(2Fe-2S)-binding protein n=1 Tax=Hahella ganghwensis TaxID=286420 RepID=UPI00035ED1C3|nr:(2Fe-2S)-binding protein [Hahella ganghwensis]
MGIELTINGEKHTLEVAEDTPLLWAIRDHLHLTGTKYGCGMAQCGACTVHLNGNAIRSCVTPVGSVAGQNVTTIEGVNSRVAKAVQTSWDDKAVVQCGYCQSGQIMSAVALLESNPAPSDEDIDNFMSGNICRCSTYVRIRAAIKDAATKLA